MFDDLSMLTNSVKNIGDYARSVVDSFFISPTEDFGIGQVKLDIVGSQKLTMPNDVTDHYVESNVAYQDQISLKPITYTIQGEVGELVYYQKDSRQTTLGFVSQKLTPIVSFLPSVSRKFSQVTDKALKVAGWLDSADNLVTRLNKMGFSREYDVDGNLTKTTLNTQQQIAYVLLIALRNQRIPIDVTTPWTQLRNFVITNVELEQPKETREKTIITISLKEFRATDLTTTKFNKAQYQARLEDQKAPPIEQGLSNGKLKSTLKIGSEIFNR